MTIFSLTWKFPYLGKTVFILRWGPPDYIFKSEAGKSMSKGSRGILPMLWIEFCRIDRVNSLAPGKFEWILRHVIFKQILVVDDWGISCEIIVIWLSLDFTDNQSTLVQVMAWCRQATSHYLSQCWPISVSPYGITRPQWVDIFQ